MAKKFVRGITDVKTINNQDYDTNNVNDLLSDGQYNYIHRKKGKNEEYHNLTDNIKTISSDNTELLSVTNNNKTTNTATLHPKHDAQKEQVLESTRDTITINHGTNGTAEKTTVDTNPEKVLEHGNLLTDYGISKTTTGNTTKLGLVFTRVEEGYDLNNLLNGSVRSGNFLNAPEANTWYFVSSFTDESCTIQEAVTLVDNKNTTYRRFKKYGVWGTWREQVGDKSVIDGLLAQKQDKLTAGDGITIQGQTISATAPTLTVYSFPPTSETVKYFAKKYVMEYPLENGRYVLTTYVLECFTDTPEHVITGELKEEFSEYMYGGNSVTNGTLTITYDGTTMKLLNSAPETQHNHQATFTYSKFISSGGGVV